MTYGITLSEQQKMAVKQTYGPCLLLAVPGGGKTTTLLCRLAYLVKVAAIEPSKILSITFSRASAKDMKERFDSLFKGTIKGDIRFSTIHSFAYSVVMSYNKKFSDRWRLIEGGVEDSQWQKGRMLSKIHYQVNREHLSDGDYEQLSNDLSYVKNTMKSREALEAYTSSIDNFMEIYETYERTKRQNKLMDFDDMLIHCYKILINQPTILLSYQERYSHIQLDEAQDTSKLQHEIVALLASKHKNLFFVADDDQSIYGFRGGAKPSYLFNIADVYEDVNVIKMEMNYRSTKAIVALCNIFIKNNKMRYDKQIVTDNERGISVAIEEVSRRKDQYKVLVDKIRNLTLEEDKEDPNPSIGIIYRNNFSAVRLVKYFEKKGGA